MENALKSVVQVISNIVNVIKNLVGYVLGKVSWQELMESAGKLFREVGNFFAIINPIRYAYNLLMDSELTRHSFKELDKFTGGLLTDVTNLSDIAFRGMRGDAISKMELMRCAFAALKIAAVFSFGIGGALQINFTAAGGIVGSWFGNEICKHQTASNQGACKAAFAVVGAVTGSGIGNYLKDQAVVDTAFENVKDEASMREAERLAAEQAERTVFDSVYEAGQAEIKKQLSKEVVDQLEVICQRQNWAGDRECTVIGSIARDYIAKDPDKSLTQFLAEQAAELGVSLVLERVFPVESPEARAVRKEYVRRYYDVPYDVVYDEPQKSNAGALLALTAAGAGLLLLGAG